MSNAKPAERVSYRRLFWILALLNLVAAAWVVWDETVTRRPWKHYQSRFNALLEQRGERTEPIGLRQITNKALGIVDRCHSCHLGVDRPGLTGDDIPRVFRSHPRRKELLGGHHPVKRFGCTVCHQGQGAQTKGIGGRAFDHGRNDPYWDRPMLSTVFAESACVGCHRDQKRIPGADVYNRGRALFIDKRCWGCHETDLVKPTFASAPALDQTPAKLSPAWITAWLRQPSAFRPDTPMPSFWPRPRRPDGEPVEQTSDAYRAWKARRASEIRAIVAYLGSVKAKKPLPQLPLPPPNDAALIARGAQLFDTVGCRGCHRLGEPAAADARNRFGPDLSRVGEKASAAWLAAWLTDPAALSPHTRMPNLRLSAAERNALVAFLVSRRRPNAAAATPRWPAADKALIDTGKKTIRKYGCYGCHQIPGITIAAKAGPDLSQFGDKTADRLTWGRAEHSCDTPALECWTLTKLQRPRWQGGNRVQLLMPHYQLTKAEARALAVFLMANRRPPPGYRYEPKPKQRALDRGEAVLARNNCRACHEIGRTEKRIKDDSGDVEVKYIPNGADTRKYYKSAALAPPPLTFAGDKFQYSWLFDFLSRPFKIRPWLVARMPTFQLSDTDRRDIIGYFAARNNQPFPLRKANLPRLSPTTRAEARAMFAKFKCRSCHQSASGDTRAVADRAPDLAMASRRLRAAWIRTWLRDPQHLQPGTRMPTFFPLEDEDKPKGPRITPCADCFGGDIAKQIDALTAIALEQQPGPPPAPPPAKKDAATQK